MVGNWLKLMDLYMKAEGRW